MHKRSYKLFTVLFVSCFMHFTFQLSQPFGLFWQTPYKITYLLDNLFQSTDPFFWLLLYVLYIVLILCIKKIKRIGEMLQYIGYALMPLVALMLALMLKRLLTNDTDVSINNIASLYRDHYLWLLTFLLYAFLYITKKSQDNNDTNGRPQTLIFNYTAQMFNQISNWACNKDYTHQVKRQLFLKNVFWFLLIGFFVFCFLFGLPLLGTLMARKVLALTGCAPAFDYQPACFNDGFIQSRFGPLSTWLSALMTPIFFMVIFADVLIIWLILIIICGLFAFKKITN